MVNPTRLDTAIEEIRAVATGNVSYADGYRLDAAPSPAETATLREQAVAAASESEVAVVFLGLPAYRHAAEAGG